MSIKRILAICLVLMTFVGTFCLANSALINVALIKNAGEILTNGRTANSGSPNDIQAAVNAVAALGGGTIYIPAGNFTFNGEVTIPYAASIQIIGAGIGQTILTETTEPGSNAMFNRVWDGSASPGAAIHISGISFVGMVVSESTTNNAGVNIRCTKDWHIDYCAFNNFDSAGVYTDDNTANTVHLINSGVIDHCTFDNKYKNTYTNSYWGYGVIVVGDYYTWGSLSAYQGTFDTVPDTVVYVENCVFTRCRHCIAGNGGGYYVSRYNVFNSPAPYGMNDAHGSSGPTNIGTRGYEIYSNIFNMTDETYINGPLDPTVGGRTIGCQLRGGGGVVYSNTFVFKAGTTHALESVDLQNDATVSGCQVHDLYVWNNTAKYSNGATIIFTNTINNEAGYVQNTDYFLYALSGYSPYPYPHPLALNS